MLEFAFEIGSGLLTEVRRLQSLLGERDKAIQDMKEEKDDLEKSLEGLKSTLQTQEQSAGQSNHNHSMSKTKNAAQINSRKKTGIWKSHFRSYGLSSWNPKRLFSDSKLK